MTLKMPLQALGLFLFATLNLLSCAGSPGQTRPQAADGASLEARKLKPDHAPTPFSADQIRRGCPPGHTITWRVEVSGAAPTLKTLRFLEGDGKGTLFESTTGSLEGEGEGDPEQSWASWSELQAHASFPTAHTRMSEVNLTLDERTYACLHYQVTSPQGVSLFWFAKELPGPPIQLIQRKAGQEVMRMVRVESPGQ